MVNRLLLALELLVVVEVVHRVVLHQHFDRLSRLQLHYLNKLYQL